MVSACLIRFQIRIVQMSAVSIDKMCVLRVLESITSVLSILFELDLRFTNVRAANTFADLFMYTTL